MNVVRNLLLICLSTLATLAVIEGYLIHDNAFSAPTGYAYAGSELPYQLLVDIEHEASPGNTLYVLGDSFVAGIACAADKQDFPSRLDAQLNSVKVLNLGVPGGSLVNYIDIVEKLPLTTGDSVLVVLYDNDIHIARQDCQLAKSQSERHNSFYPQTCQAIGSTSGPTKDEQGFLRWLNTYLRDFKLVQLLKESAYNVPLLQQFFYRRERDSLWSLPDSDEFKLLSSSLVLLDSLLHDTGVSVFYTYYPNTNFIDASDPRHALWQGFIGYASNTLGINISDPFPYFVANAPERSMVWSLTDKHPDCAAHGIMADYVRKDILEPAIGKQPSD